MFKDKGITIRIDNYTAKTTAHHHFRSDIELIRFLNMIFDFYVQSQDQEFSPKMKIKILISLLKYFSEYNFKPGVQQKESLL